MQDETRGQVSRSAADVYDEFFVPALFGQWAAPVLEMAGVRPGMAVLDVACGTGALAREAVARVGSDGKVAGLDPNPGMLEVARREAPGIDWRQGRAEELPFENASFDAVVSQFGMMFFEDRVRAMREMWRVLRPGGQLVVAVWSALDDTPGYAAVAALLQRLFGDSVADQLRAPFVLGDPELLRATCAEAGVVAPEVRRVEGTARFPSLESWMHTEIKGWTLADAIDDDQYALLQREAQDALARFVQPDGTVSFTAPAYLVSAAKA